MWEARIIIQNGRSIPFGEARIHPLSVATAYGAGVFEGIRFYNGRIFKSRSHLERIYRNAEAIRINVPYSKDEMHKMMHECIRANGLKVTPQRRHVDLGHTARLTIRLAGEHAGLAPEWPDRRRLGGKFL